MKKMLAVMLGLILIMLSVTGCARPDPHYVTAEDFDIEFYPVSDEGQTFASGLTALQIVMNTPNVELGTGEIAVTRVSDGKEIFRYDARMDGDHIFLNSSTNMDEKFFYVDDVKGFVGDYLDTEWEFTIGNYGYDGNISEMPITYLVGDIIEIPVAIGDEAAQAILLYDNVSVVSAEHRALSENGVFKLDTVGEGTATISVMFLDENGMHVETLGFTVTVK